MSGFNQAEIQQALLCGELKLFEEIDSTNEFLLKNAESLPSGSLCLAECQTAGRGRRGRQWYSPQSENLYFSMLWRYESGDFSTLSSLSLVVALVIAETFEQLGVEEIQIKWPNDIYYQGKKTGGILIENKLDKNGISLVIGIGLNLGMGVVDQTVVTQAWSDLAAYRLNRNQLAAQLANKLQHTLIAFPYTHFSTYLPLWQRFDIFYNRSVKLLTEQGEIHGISQGINEKGELLLERDGSIECYAIGEISLRAQENELS